MKQRIVTFWQGLPPGRRKLAGWAAGLLAFYTICGFLVLPLVVRAVAAKRLAAELNREVVIRSVRINPYALSCSVRGLLVKDRDGEPFISWDDVYVNFQLSSFFGKPWVFKEISTTNTYLRAQMNKDYTFNFSDLIEKHSTNTQPRAASKPLALRVRQLSIRGARAALADMTPRAPFRRIVGPLQITLNNFHTDPDNRNPYSFSGSTDSGEEFSWRGHFFLNPVRAAGELSVANVALNKYAALYQDFFRFEIRDGVASLRGAYELISAQGTNLVRVTNVVAELRAFNVAEPGATQSLVEVPGLTVSQLSGDLADRRVSIESLSVTGAVLSLRRSKDASINLVEMARPAEGASNAPGGILVLLQAVTNAFSTLLASTNKGLASLRHLSIENCSASLQDDVHSRPVSLRLDEINVSAENLSNSPGTNLSADVSLRWNTNGSIKTDVTASLLPLSADVGLRLEQVELYPLSPYLEPHLNLYVLGSKLGLDARVQLRAQPDQLPVVTFSGSSSLDDFATVDGVLTEDLVKWRALRFDGIEANLHPPAVSVAKVQIDDAVARVVIGSNHVVNVLAALRPANTNVPAASATPERVVDATPKQRKPALGLVKDLMSRTNALGLTNVPSLHIGVIAISNAHLQLLDQSLTSPVRASLQQVNGVISDISSEEVRSARIHLGGRVDNSGPVEIIGRFNPLHRDAASELKVTLQEVDLHPGDPYSARFLGYRLRRGKLDVEVAYEVSAKHLKGKNVIRLDQFTLGDKVESPDATKLPVKLGVALLKDRSGKIELDVPVEGNLDDPEFRLGRVIWRTVANVFTKIVTSPFSALGSLFGGQGEEISYQEFEPGMASLPPAARQKLDVLANTLYERPGLELEIEGHLDLTTDPPALRRLKLGEQLRTAKWATLRKAEQAATSPEQTVVAPEERSRFLVQLYQQTFGKSRDSSGAAAPKNLIPAPTQPAKGAQALVTQPKPLPQEQASDIERELLESIQIGEADLQTLAAERARQVREYLLQTGKTEPERVYLTREVSNTATNGHRAYVHLR